MKKTGTVTKRKPMSCEQMTETLTRMESIVDGKLENQKGFIPILFTIVTSILAFILVNNLGNTVQTAQMYLIVCCYALICFAVLIFALFGQSDYEARVKKRKKAFYPFILSSYCHLSDAEFIKQLTKYAGRSLNNSEMLRANCIKQKINEYTFKKGCLNLVLAIILAGVVLLGIICFLGIFILPSLPQYSGGNV